MCIKVFTNYPNCIKPASTLTFPHHQRAKSEFDFHFGIASATGLLYLGLGCIGLPYFVTNRTDGYKYIKVLCLFCGFI